MSDKPTLAEVRARLTAPGAPFEMEEEVIGGVRLRVWKNQPATLRDLFEAARRYGDREFLIFEDERVTYDAFRRATLNLAGELVKSGLQKGDRLALGTSNLPEWPVAFFAGVLAGAILVPLGPELGESTLIEALADAGARMAVMEDDVLRRLASRLKEVPTLERLYVCRAGEGDLPRGASRLEAVIGAPGSWAGLPEIARPDVAISPDDDASMFYTSGTTGRPKAPVSSHRNLTSIYRVAAYAQARMMLLAGREYSEPDPLEGRQGCSLLSSAIASVTSFASGLIPTLTRGDKFVLMRRWDPEEAMRLIERERINSTGGPPAMVRQLMDHPNREKYDLSSLRFLRYGGAPAASGLPEEMRAAFRKAIPGQAYGLTETSSHVCNAAGAECLDHPDSCGMPPPVVDIRIMDGEREASTGEIGEVWVQGPQVTRGYWNRPAETAAAYIDGWLRTGDMGRLDEDGRLYVIDRAKDMIIRGGENIYAGEVEVVLMEHPDVAEAAVLPRPHPLFGEEPVAVVVLKPGGRAGEKEIRVFARKHLPLYKVPVAVEISLEALPRNEGGKVLKAELKARLAASAGGLKQFVKV